MGDVAVEMKPVALGQSGRLRKRRQSAWWISTVAWTRAALVTLARTWDETNIYLKGTVSSVK